MDFIDIARDFLYAVSSELDPYTSEKGRVVIEGNNRVTLFTPSHIHFAKYGRAPGKNPPLDPILEWVSKKGIIFEGTDARGTAFAIMKSIGKNGTLNYVPNAPDAMEEAIDIHIVTFSKGLAMAEIVRIDAEVQKIYKQMFTEKLNFKI